MALMDAPPTVDLAAVHRASYRSLVRLASLLLDDIGQCEEVVQDAFVAVYRRPDRLQDPSRLPAYLRSAVLNGARSVLRRRRMRERPALRAAGIDAPSPDVQAVLDDDRRAVLDALRALPDRQRDVLALRYWGELSESEIAETLGIAPGTVKTHAKRALDALAHKLEDRQ